MKEKLRQGFQKIKNTIFSSTARRLIVAWGTIVILFGGFGVWKELDLRAIGFYMAGVFAAPVGLWLAWRRTHALQEQAKADAKKADALIEQAQSHAFQSETDSKRQFSEAFARAVELLGNDNVAVRQGAIHALAGLARENPEQHQTIFNIITSYIRERSPNPPAEGTPEKLPVDIESAVMEVINRNSEPEEGEVRRYDLSNTYLKGILAPKINSDFKNFIFSRADLSTSGFITPDFSKCFLVKTDFSESFLKSANFSNAKLYSANLSMAILNGANLSKVDFACANLSKAKLHGADLSNAENLTQEQIDQAEGDEKTMLPDGIKRPDTWIKKLPSDAKTSNPCDK